MFEKEAKKWVKEHTEIEYIASYGEFPKEPSATKSFKAGAEFGYAKGKEEAEELKRLLEKYRQAVDKCLHITFMGAGCQVHTIAEYSALVDGYLIDVEGLAKWKN